MVRTRPVFIRLPEGEALRLDQTCAARGMTKQAFVSAAVVSRLDGESEAGGATAGGDDVMTLDEVAALLRVHPQSVKRRVDAGDLPGRRFDDAWRFSRCGVLAWLASVEEPGRRTPGFEAPTTR